ncbi:MAG: substrate-binding domain-containing protein [Chloroflexi bacterium]|nr:substrate-binding domain-containing protein [Chloroflexota bacterium]MCI0577964.1 substrate-binding domain-containing protein [Chloroflexota bacterium]MCI0649274.1 substrate-binding domain-containing protein [Chloroflexota bacterium]MCI0729467.1 substrate-binding domain-containing protein [Chloroflexota bacterium]
MVACRPAPEPPPPITPTPPAEMLPIGLSTSAAPLAALVIEPYTRQTKQVRPQFILANNATLFEDLAAGQVDAILVHHVPEGSNVWFNPVALDGLVIVVHPDNPVRALGRAEVQAIFSGRLDNWSAVGGPDLPITLVSRERGAGTRILFGQRIMAEQRVAITALVASGDEALRAAVASEPGAIGYTMMGAAGALPALAIDGLAATPTTTADQSYPLTVPLYFVSLAEPVGELRAFLAWLQSDDGQATLGVQYGRVR